MVKDMLLSAALLVLGYTANAQNGNVGIGTTSPGTALDVNGAITTRETEIIVTGNACTVPANNSFVRITGTPSAAFRVNANGVTGQRLVIYNNSTGGYNATLNDYPILNGRIIEFVNLNGRYLPNNNAPDINDWSINGNSGTTAVTDFAGTADRNDVVIRTANQERMRIGTSGNVSMGPVTATAKLHVDGNINVTDSLLCMDEIVTRAHAITDRDVAVDVNGWNNGRLSNAGLAIGGINSGEGIASRRNGSGNINGLDLYTNGAPRLSIHNNGNVTIGTASSQANSKLTVRGGMYSAGNIVCGDINAGGDIIATGRVSQYVWESGWIRLNGFTSQTFQLTNMRTIYPVLMCSIRRSGDDSSDLTVSYINTGNRTAEVRILNSYINDQTVKVHCIQID